MATRILKAALACWAIAAPAAASAGTPAPFDHVFVIVLENRSYGAVVGNPDLPTLNALAGRYGQAADHHGVAHPSLPNYVALLTGDTWGSRSDDPSQTFDHPTLAGQLEAAGLSWKGYMQGLPSPGFTGAYAGDPVLYAKKHNPLLLAPAIADDPQRAARVVPLAQLDADLRAGAAPTFALIVPDVCHDMHGAPSCRGTAALDRAGDAFVRRLVDGIQGSSVWRQHTAIVITFDEGVGDANHIATIVLTSRGPRGVVLHATTDHYALLRTLEEGWGLPLLGRARDAASMAELFW